MFASAPGTHKPARTTWSSSRFFSLPPLVSYLPATLVQGSGPRRLHTTPSLRPQALVGYCSTVVPLFFFTDIQHISQKRATVVYSIPSVGGYQQVRSQSRLILLVYPVPESRVCQSLAVYAVGSANKGRWTEASAALPVCTSIMTLTRALGPPLRPAQQRSDPESQPQDQHPR